MEDDRVAILEAQLAQAKLIAEEADKKYEEVEFHRRACPLKCTFWWLRKTLFKPLLSKLLIW